MEDDAVIRHLYHTRFLQQKGYNILEAKDGKEALDIIQRYTDPIHLMVTDVVKVPQLTGPQWVERIASTRRGLKVLYISGFTKESIIQRGILGADMPFLEKPFGREELALRIRQLLDASLRPSKRRILFLQAILRILFHDGILQTRHNTGADYVPVEYSRRPGSGQKQNTLHLFQLTLLYAAYVLSGYWGLSLHASSGLSSPIWPPNGIALALLFLYGFDLWPAVLLGSFSVNLLRGSLIPLGLYLYLQPTPWKLFLGCYLLRLF